MMYAFSLGIYLGSGTLGFHLQVLVILSAASFPIQLSSIDLEKQQGGLSSLGLGAWLESKNKLLFPAFAMALPQLLRPVGE